MLKTDCIIRTSFAPLYLEPSFKSELVSQALIWEHLDILDKKNDWYKVRQKDNYVSWVHKFYIIDSSIYAQHHLNDPTKWYYVVKCLYNVKNINFLSFGSVVPVVNKTADTFYEVLLPDENIINIDKVHLFKYNTSISITDISNYLGDLIGIPYLWGGKSSMGYDCSGLVQIIMFLLGFKFPRDTSDQINFNEIIKISKKPILGDLIFFKKDNIVCHVGFYLNSNEFIHSSGCVKISSIYKDNKYFDDELAQLQNELYRVKYDC